MTSAGVRMTWPVIGHAESIERLRRMALRNRVPTALLLAGPDMTGRRTVALEFSRVLLCPNAIGAVACGECSSCRRVTSRNHPDVDYWGLERQVADRGVSLSGSLTIDTMREVAASATLRPHESERRVVIVDDAETLGEDAQQALLKTLEDAPPFTSIILIATTVDSMISTVRSRVVEIPFQLVSSAEIATGLRTLRPEADADEITRLAQGRAAWAIAAADQPARIEDEREASANVERWVAQSRRDRLVEAYRRGNELVATLSRGGEAAKMQRQERFAEMHQDIARAILVWRDLLLSANGNEDLAFDPKRAQRLAYSFRHGTGDLYNALSACRQCQFDLQHNVRPKLALELMVTQWPILS